MRDLVDLVDIYIAAVADIGVGTLEHIGHALENAHGCAELRPLDRIELAQDVFLFGVLAHFEQLDALEFAGRRLVLDTQPVEELFE